MGHGSITAQNHVDNSLSQPRSLSEANGNNMSGDIDKANFGCISRGDRPAIVLVVSIKLPRGSLKPSLKTLENVFGQVGRTRTL